MKTVVILFGPPGSGKGTFSQHYAEQYSFVKHVSLGSICRIYAQEESDFGKNIKNIIENGNLIDISLIKIIIEKIFDNFISEDNLKETILILDGYPRNIDQFLLFFSLYDKYKLYFNYVIFFFSIQFDILLKRLLTRYICSNVSCDKIFSINNENQRLNCSTCESSLYKRQDDAAEIIQKRLDIYFNEEKNILNLLKNNSINYSLINANNTIENICSDINDKLLFQNINFVKKVVSYEIN